MARIQKARHHVESRGLAGAVWPDQADNLALADGKVHVRERDEPAEAHGNLLDFQCRRASQHHACSLTSRFEKAIGATGSAWLRRLANLSASDGTMPRGNTNRI